jgi:hypothetical protein
MDIGELVQSDRAQCDDRDEVLRRTYVLYRRELCSFLRVRFGAGPPDPHDLA